jgi:hypothetical protein
MDTGEFQSAPRASLLFVWSHSHGATPKVFERRGGRVAREFQFIFIF